MHRRSQYTKYLVLLMLFALLVIPVITQAQEATPSGEGGETTETEASSQETVGETTQAAEEEGGGVLTPLGINFGLLLAQIVNFLLVFGLLGYFLWRPLANMLDSRTTQIAKGLEDAAAAANARKNAEAEAEKILAQARAESQKLIEEARGRGEEVAKAVETEARAEADKIRQDARTSAEAERNAELAGLRGQVTAISVAVAQRLIGASLLDDAKKQQAIINDFFSKVPADARKLSGAVTVVSAMPLSDAEQKSVTKELGASDVTFTVDPTILGGLVVRAGDRVIDGSVRSGLTDLSSRLN